MHFNSLSKLAFAGGIILFASFVLLFIRETIFCANIEGLEYHAGVVYIYFKMSDGMHFLLGMNVISFIVQCVFMAGIAIVCIAGMMRKRYFLGTGAILGAITVLLMLCTAYNLWLDSETRETFRSLFALMTILVPLLAVNGMILMTIDGFKNGMQAKSIVPIVALAVYIVPGFITIPIRQAIASLGNDLLFLVNYIIFDFFIVAFNFIVALYVMMLLPSEKVLAEHTSPSLNPA